MVHGLFIFDGDRNTRNVAAAEPCQPALGFRRGVMKAQDLDGWIVRQPAIAPGHGVVVISPQDHVLFHGGFFLPSGNISFCEEDHSIVEN